VFSERPLAGNPLAVFPDASGLSGELMQRTARELNLSETAFVLPAEDPGADARLRIFTPAVELPFAGHPVLGSAVAVAPRLSTGELRLQTGVGVIAVSLRPGADGAAFAEMAHPVGAPEPVHEATRVLAALGLEGSELPVEAYRNGPLHAYVALADPGMVAALRPDLTALARLGENLGVSCFALSGTRVKTRMFAPALGVAEDPATGSAAGPLAAHLVRHGWIRRGQALEIHQGEEIGRPSVLHARFDDPRGAVVGGSAVIVAEGNYRLQ
jgi:trans-2,3-dihydro-3-hydroxyanthranilate isomerase